MRKFLKNHNGVTMVEVLVTVAILAIVVAPCLSAFVMAQRGNVKAAETQAAYTSAANLMEELKGLPDVDSVAIRLNMNYPEDSTEKANANDGVYVIYQAVKNESTDNTQYYRVWIYPGEDANQQLESDTAPDGYLLKGVIAP